MMEGLLIVSGTVLATFLLILWDRRSWRRHDKWLEEHGYPPRETKRKPRHKGE